MVNSENEGPHKLDRFVVYLLVICEDERFCVCNHPVSTLACSRVAARLQYWHQLAFPCNLAARLRMRKFLDLDRSLATTLLQNCKISNKFQTCCKIAKQLIFAPKLLVKFATMSQEEITDCTAEQACYKIARNTRILLSRATFLHNRKTMCPPRLFSTFAAMLQKNVRQDWAGSLLKGCHKIVFCFQPFPMQCSCVSF